MRLIPLVKWTCHQPTVISERSLGCVP